MHDLTLEAYAYKARLVITEGTLTFSEEHGRYQVVDDANYAVVIRNFRTRVKLEAARRASVCA